MGGSSGRLCGGRKRDWHRPHERTGRAHTRAAAASGGRRAVQRGRTMLPNMEDGLVSSASL
jgi:hypothetical protein